MRCYKKYVTLILVISCFSTILSQENNIPDLSQLLYEAQNQYDKGNLDEALLKYEEILNYNSKNYDALVGKANILLDKKNNRTSCEFFKKALNIDPGDPFIWQKYVLALEEFNDIADLEDQYENWAKYDTEEPYPHHKLLEIQLKDNNTSKAIDELVYLKGLGALSYNDMVLLGELYEKQEMEELAIEEYLNAISYDRTKLKAHLQLGKIYWNNEQLVEASNEFNEIIRYHPSKAIGHYYMGLVLVEMADEQRAIHELEIVLSPDKKSEYIEELGENNYNKAIKILSELYYLQNEFQSSLEIIEFGKEKGFKDAELELIAGKSYINSGNKHEAIQSLKNAISLNPKLSEAYKIMGSIYLDFGEISEAVSILEEGVGIDGDNFELRVLLGDAYYNADDLNSAEKQYRKAKELNPSDFKVYFELGKIYLKQGNYKKSVDEFNSGLTLDKTNPNTYLLLGKAYLELNDLSKAREAFESSIKLDDRNPETYKCLGLVFIGEENFEEAIPEFQRAIQLDFKMTDAHFYLGNSLEALENYHRAIEEYKICIEQKPEVPEYLTAIGRTYYLNGNLDVAEENLNKSLEISENLLDTYFYLGRIYESRKDFSSAIDYYYKAEKLNPDNIENLLRLGRLLILEDRVEEAKDLLEHATDISPESVSAHALLSIVYEDLEEYDKASDEHKILNKLEPENYIHLKNLGYTERIRGKYDSAIETLTKATKLNDTDPEIYEMLGDLYRIKGSEAKKWKRYEDELKYYQKAYDYYNNFLTLNPTPENLTFIKEFLDGFKRYKNLPLEERQRIEFHLWW